MGRKIENFKREWEASKREQAELERLQREYNQKGGKGRRP